MSAQPLSVQAWLAWLRELLQEENYDEVLSVIQAGSQWRESIPIVRYYEAMSHMRLGHWAQALNCIERLLEDEPDRPVLLLDRAWCLIELGRCEEAEQILEPDGPLLSQRPPRLVLLARIAVRQARHDMASSYLSLALKLDPYVSDFVSEFDELRSVRTGPVSLG